MVKNKERRKYIRRIIKPGDKFGYLTVVEALSDGYFRCKCDCGNETVVKKYVLTHGLKKSCGCLWGHVDRGKEPGHFDPAPYVSVSKEFGTNVVRIINQTPNKNNTSGFRGVYYIKTTDKYAARITFRRKTYYLGVYDTFEEAKAARIAAEEKLIEPFLEDNIDLIVERLDSIKKSK